MGGGNSGSNIIQAEIFSHQRDDGIKLVHISY